MVDWFLIREPSPFNGVRTLSARIKDWDGCWVDNQERLSQGTLNSLKTGAMKFCIPKRWVICVLIKIKTSATMIDTNFRPLYWKIVEGPFTQNSDWYPVQTCDQRHCHIFLSTMCYFPWSSDLFSQNDTAVLLPPHFIDADLAGIESFVSL